MVENMGGIVLDNDRAGVLMNTHSQLPNCFDIVKDEKDLIIGTGLTDEIKYLKPKPRGRSSSSTRDGENEPSQHSVVAKPILIDPEPYVIHPGSELDGNRVNDKRPLLLDQCSGKTSVENVSAIVALKRYRDRKFKQLLFEILLCGVVQVLI